jgi:hypothetical protein
MPRNTRLLQHANKLGSTLSVLSQTDEQKMLVSSSSHLISEGLSIDPQKNGAGACPICKGNAIVDGPRFIFGFEHGVFAFVIRTLFAVSR